MPLTEILRRRSWWRACAQARTKVDAAPAWLSTLETKLDKLMSITSDLLAAVAAEKNETLAARLAIGGLQAQIVALNDKITAGAIDPVAVQQAINDLAADAHATALAIPADAATPVVVPVGPVAPAAPAPVASQAIEPPPPSPAVTSVVDSTGAPPHVVEPAVTAHADATAAGASLTEATDAAHAAAVNAGASHDQATAVAEAISTAPAT